MSISLSKLEVREPVRYKALSVFPLYSNGTSPLEYLLAEEAISSSAVVVEEISEQGSVPYLRVRNLSNKRVLFLEGEELLGAKQNRVLNTTVLIAPSKELNLPVSCVERGRWHARSKTFSSSDHISSSTLRKHLKASVHRSLKEKLGHRSDQDKVWQEVDRMDASLNVGSTTSAMNDTYQTYSQQLNEARQQIGYPGGAIGIAVAMGSKIVAVDVFDQPHTCEQMWDRLLRGHSLESITTQETDATPSTLEVQQFLRLFEGSTWETHPAVGEGIEQRVEQNGGMGSALLVEEIPVHVSMMSA